MSNRDLGRATQTDPDDIQPSAKFSESENSAWKPQTKQPIAEDFSSGTSIASSLEIMKTTIVNLAIAGFISVAATGFVGCADTEPVPYNPPVKVVHEPTALTTVPATASSTTTTTQFGNGTVEKQTTTNYNPAYTTVGPPYKTTVVPAAPVTTTTRTTTTATDE